jgi:hypothetical protein
MTLGLLAQAAQVAPAGYMRDKPEVTRQMIVIAYELTLSNKRQSLSKPARL